MAKVILKDLKKVYPNTEKKKKVKKGEEPQEKKSNLQITDEGVVAVQQFSLEIADKEFIVLVGPSGCGKSTTLRMIAGLEDITSGELWIGDKLMNDVEPKDRDIAMVFQNYALYPHMTVYENMAFSLKLKKVPKDEIDRKVRQAAEILDITQYLDRKPKALSGGQRQRVALARALVKQADFFLLDEPLSNLDAQLRGRARKELVRIHEMYGQTMIYVTHDQIEAMTVGQRIAVINDGRIQMLDTPHEVYRRPANLFVAKFIGSPSMNIFDGRTAAGAMRLNDTEVPLTPGWAEKTGASGAERLLTGVRPEDITLTAEPEAGSVPVEIQYHEDYGSRVGYYFTVNGEEVIAIMRDDVLHGAGHAYWKPDPKTLHFFDAKTESNVGYPAEAAE